MKGERLSAAGFDALNSQLSERDRAIVADVLRFKLLSARQIEALHFSAELHATTMTAARTCRRVLNRLVRDRLLVRLQRRTVGGVWAGSASFIYAVGPIGHLLDDAGRTRRRFREPTATFVNHTLAIVDVLVHLRQAERRSRVEILRLESEPSCWRPMGSHGNVLRPDLFVALALNDYEHHSFVEVDLGTEGLPRLIAKCRSYVAYFDSGVEQATHDIFPRVIWLLNDEARAKRLLDTIHRRRLQPDLFTVARLDDALSALTDGETIEAGAGS